MQSEAVVDRYLALLRASPDLSDDVIVETLIGAGASPEDAWQAAHLVPVAFCRQLWEPAGVTFGSGYVVMDQQSRPIVRGPLAELPIFVTASARARVVSDSDFASAVARRSAESDAIAMAQRDGGKLDAIQVGDVTFIDPQIFANARSDEALLATTDAIHCEVCNLPHRRGVVTCEDCGHFLGRGPDWPAVRGRRSSQGCAAASALAAVLVTLALNIWAFGGAGYIVIIAPFVWFVRSAYQFRVLSKSLERHSHE